MKWVSDRYIGLRRPPESVEVGSLQFSRVGRGLFNFLKFYCAQTVHSAAFYKHDDLSVTVDLTSVRLLKHNTE